MIERIAIFIDASNLFYAQRQEGWLLDPAKIPTFFSTDSTKVVHCFWYAAVNVGEDTQQGFRQALTNNGFTVITKDLQSWSDGEGVTTSKANMDAEMITHMLLLKEQYDTCVVFSGDGDFVFPIEALRANGKRIVVVSSTKTLALALRNAADSFISLKDHKDYWFKSDWGWNNSRPSVAPAEASRPIISRFNKVEE
jgi:uncharacterized LabA/DUF88 family protein